MGRHFCRNGCRGNGKNQRTIRRIIWASDHPLGKEQLKVLQELHPDLRVNWDPGLIGNDCDSAVKALRKCHDAFVYLVCSKAQKTVLDLECGRDRSLSYGFFSKVRHNEGRENFDFVFQVSHGEMEVVWERRKCLAEVV